MVYQKLNTESIEREAILNLTRIWGCFLLRNNQLFGEALTTVDFTGLYMRLSGILVIVLGRHNFEGMAVEIRLIMTVAIPLK